VRVAVILMFCATVIATFGGATVAFAFERAMMSTRCRLHHLNTSGQMLAVTDAHSEYEVAHIERCVDKKGRCLTSSSPSGFMYRAKAL
jgi:hypothetical protein